jgi:hypothetical protein
MIMAGYITYGFRGTRIGIPAYAGADNRADAHVHASTFGYPDTDA